MAAFWKFLGVTIVLIGGLIVAISPFTVLGGAQGSDLMWMWGVGLGLVGLSFIFMKLSERAQRSSR